VVLASERTNYDPYGGAIGKTVNGIGYTGHVMDGATGLTYMQQRYYDQGVGRFLSNDPLSADANSGSNFNRYKYASGNPYRFVDPDGRSDWNLADPTDGTYAAGQAFDIPGMYTITGHGSDAGIARQNGRLMRDGGDIVREARSNHGLKFGEPIFVAACNLANGRVPQEMANTNGSLVFAADGFVRTPTTIDTDPTDARKPYQAGNPVTLTVNRGENGTGSAGTFRMFTPQGVGPSGPAINSVKFDPSTGKATVTFDPSVGSRIGETRTICADKTKC